MVLDPFFGTGTTGAVAKRLGRHFVGVEREAAYIATAEARIASVARAPMSALEPTASKRNEPRVPFGTLIESGLIAPGAILTDARARHEAEVRADGSLRAGSHVGSIHRVGALVQGLARLQRLDLLALRGSGRACADRRPQARRADRDGGGGGVE